MLRSALFILIIFLSFSIFPNIGLNSYRATVNPKHSLLSPFPARQTIIFAALPTFKDQVQTSFVSADARPEIIRQYLAKYKSELTPYADLIVNLADKYNFDYRWLVAIAQQESNLCKRIPKNSHNCWGWGIYGHKTTRFDSYEQALNTIAPKFKDTFLDGEHLRDPYKVMETYTPPSDGSWAFGVDQFFKELE